MFKFTDESGNNSSKYASQSQDSMFASVAATPGTQSQESNHPFESSTKVPHFSTSEYFQVEPIFEIEGRFYPIINSLEFSNSSPGGNPLCVCLLAASLSFGSLDKDNRFGSIGSLVQFSQSIFGFWGDLLQCMKVAMPESTSSPSSSGRPGRRVRFSAQETPPNDPARQPEIATSFAEKARELHIGLSDFETAVVARSPQELDGLKVAAMGLMAVSHYPSFAHIIAKSYVNATVPLMDDSESVVEFESFIRCYSSVLGPELYHLTQTLNSPVIDLVVPDTSSSASVEVQSRLPLRSELRHRASWMLVGVLRERLRWLMDPPGATISAQGAVALAERNDIDRSMVSHQITKYFPKFRSFRDEGTDRITRILTPVPRGSNLDDLPLSYLFAEALRQFYDLIQLKTWVESNTSYSFDNWIANELQLVNPHLKCGTALVILGGEVARLFIVNILDCKLILDEGHRGGVWEVLETHASLLKQRCFSEDEHYSYLSNITELRASVSSCIVAVSSISSASRVLAGLEARVNRAKNPAAMGLSKTEFQDLKSILHCNHTLRVFPVLQTQNDNRLV